MSIFGLTFPFYYAGADPLPMLCLVVAGGALCLYGGLLLVANVVTRGRRTVRFLGPLAGHEIADELGNGILLGLGCGLLGGIAFEVVQARIGYLFFVSPPFLVTGLLLGVELGALAGLLVGRVTGFSRGIAIGLGAGVAGGLLVFRLQFGPSAGYGPAFGGGVGAEVARAYGMLGGLLGAFLATLLAGAFARRRRWWRTFLIGMAGGALAGMALALVGILSKQFNVMPQVLNGFGGALLLAAGGALLGGVAGGLAGQQRGETSGATLASRARLPSWLVAAPALFLGLLGGLAVGLTYQYVGANIIPIPGSNPQTGMVGLLVGGATGLLGGIGIAALWNRAGKPELDRQAASTGARLGTGIALILLGVVVLTLPYWFTPLLGLNIA